MLNISTAWLHETSAKPLELFDNTQSGKCLIKWTPVEGEEYTVGFLEFSDIEEERTNMPKGDITVLMWGGTKEIPRIWSGGIRREGSYTETELRKIFGVQSRRLTALCAIIHLALPGMDKAMGMAKAKKLRDDTTTVH